MTSTIMFMIGSIGLLYGFAALIAKASDAGYGINRLFGEKW